MVPLRAIGLTVISLLLVLTQGVRQKVEQVGISSNAHTTLVKRTGGKCCCRQLSVGECKVQTKARFQIRDAFNEQWCCKSNWFTCDFGGPLSKKPYKKHVNDIALSTDTFHGFGREAQSGVMQLLATKAPSDMDSHIDFKITEAVKALNHNPKPFGTALYGGTRVLSSCKPDEGVPHIHVHGYSQSKVPAFLVAVVETMRTLGAAEVEGIFRESPEKNAQTKLRRKIEKGTLDAIGHDLVYYAKPDLKSRSGSAILLAVLLKEWLGELPDNGKPLDYMMVFNTGLGKSVPVLQFLESKTPPTHHVIYASIRNLPEPMRTFMVYFLDFMVEIAYKFMLKDKDGVLRPQTKMTPRNLAVCVAPNFLTVSSGKMMTLIGQQITFVQVMIEAWKKFGKGASSESAWWVAE